VLRKQLEYPDLKRAVREQQTLFNASVVLIEDRYSAHTRAHRRGLLCRYEV
jgi:hypothetical protein